MKTINNCIKLVLMGFFKDYSFNRFYALGNTQSYQTLSSVELMTYDLILYVTLHQPKLILYFYYLV